MTKDKLSLARQIIQTLYLLFSLYIGFKFYLFCKWATDSGNFYERPPSVEGFLPISALVGLRNLQLTGLWDWIHPAGLTIFLAILFSSFFFRKGFCGWICPIGTVSNIIDSLSEKTELRLPMPSWLDTILLGCKYLLLIFFLYFVLWEMDKAQIIGFMISPYNVGADAIMLNFFLHPSNITIFSIGLIVVLSILFKGFWCRYLCPYGALTGLLASVGPILIRREKDKCLGCQKCHEACPMSIQVANKNTIRVPECIGCLECISACPEQNCLNVSSFFGLKLWPWVIPAGSITTLLIFWMIAKITGHWHSQIALAVLKQVYNVLGLKF